MTTEAPVPPPFELPAELAIDTTVARRIIGEFIRGQLRQAGFDRAVLGLSGGIDSAVVAFLVAEAIGADGLLCVLMPYRTSSPASRADAESVVAGLGCSSRLVDISPMVDGYFDGALGHAGEDADALRRGNFAARQRMAVLYDHSVTWGGLVVGTGNKTESLIGYTTLFGDAACAFNPIGDLYKSQVRQLAVDLGVPDAIIRKAPSADLWPGQTDETEGGFSLSDPRPAAVLDGRQATVRRGARRARLRPPRRRPRRPDGRDLGVQAPGPADREARAAHGRRRLPLPAPATRIRPPVTEARSRQPAGTLFVVATPIGNLADVSARALEVLRAVPLIAAEDTRLTRRLLERHAIATRMTSFHARSPVTRRTELLEHLEAGSDLALVTDAGTPGVSDPGEDLVAAWGAAGGRVVPIPGPSAVLAAIAGSGIAGPRWSFEGFLPRSGRERRERIGPDRRRRARQRPVRVTGAGRGDPPRPGGRLRHGAPRGGLPRADEDPRIDREGDARGARGVGRRRDDPGPRRDDDRHRLVVERRLRGSRRLAGGARRWRSDRGGAGPGRRPGGVRGVAR